MGTPGALIGGRYRLVRELGSGGMSVVWAAEDELLDRKVAVKQLRIQSGLSEQEAQVISERAMREARINARLHHPHVVAVFDVVEYEGQPSLVMELVPSETLAEALRQQDTLEPPEVGRVGSQVASALAAAHGLGIVHRDVKPSNILLGEDGRARISDFGISRAFGDTTLTLTGMINGTPAYLAPEVARGNESTPAADVFSLGSTLYAALEGAPPFGNDGNAIALLYKVAEADIPPPQRAGDLAPLLGRMLARDPDARPTMDEVAASLSELGGDDAATLGGDGAGLATVAVLPAAASEPTTLTEVSPTPVSPPAGDPPGTGYHGTGHRRRGWLAAMAAVVVLLAAVAMVGLLWPGAVSPDPNPDVSAVPAESSLSEQRSDAPAGEETDAPRPEDTAPRDTDEQSETSGTDEPSENRSTEEPTDSEAPTETSEPTETASESTESQSSEGDSSGEGGGDGDGGGSGIGGSEGEGGDG